MALEEYQSLLERIRRDQPLTLDDLTAVEKLTAEMPYFTLPASRMLSVEGLDEPTRRRLRAAVALNAPDFQSLCRLIDPDGSRLADFYPAEEAPATPSTEKALDTFLDTYGNGAVDPKEQQLLERLIFNPVPADYSQLLIEEDGPAQPAEQLSEQDQLLEAFLSSQGEAHRQQAETRPVEPIGEPAVIKPDAKAPLTESLAKIYIRQRHFDKAYEIISQLCLNNPKKSVYFADQLRFLRKLILIQQHEKSHSGKNK